MPERLRWFGSLNLGLLGPLGAPRRCPLVGRLRPAVAVHVELEDHRMVDHPVDGQRRGEVGACQSERDVVSIGTVEVRVVELFEFSNGITHGFALTVLCEGLGVGVPDGGDDVMEQLTHR